MPSKQFQRFCYTYFPPAEQTAEELELIYAAVHAACHYHLYGIEECPTTGKKHHQGFFWLKHANKTTECGVRKLLPKIHVEACKGSVEANIDYCRKLKSEHPNEQWVEFGKLPEDGKHDRTQLDMVLEIARTEGVQAAATSNPSVWARNLNAVWQWARMHQPPRNHKTICIYIWGISGCGKSRFIHDCGAAPVQIKHGFIRGYRNQPVIVIDDLDPQFTGMTRLEWLTLFDRYPLTLNVKGGEAEFNSKVIFVSSNNPPHEVWRDNWDDAMQRRFEKVFCFPKEKNEAQAYVKTIPCIQEAKECQAPVRVASQADSEEVSTPGPSRVPSEPSSEA